MECPILLTLGKNSGSLLQDYVTDSLTHHKTNVNKTKKKMRKHTSCGQYILEQSRTKIPQHKVKKQWV